MAHVSVTINSRQYRMACDDGQEHHLGIVERDHRKFLMSDESNDKK